MDIPEKWLDPSYTPEIRVDMVDPHNLKTIRGQLSGVTKIELTEGYYSNTKISGSIETIKDNYIGGSWLRIMVEGEPLATLGVTDVKSKRAPERSLKKTYDLQSVLWMLDSDIAFMLYTIGGGTRASTAIKAIVKDCEKEVIFEAGARDSLYAESKIFERTDSYRSILSDICEKSNNQLSIDGYGRILISAYIPPSSKAAVWTLDAQASNGIILSPGYEDDDSSGEAYNRTIIVATNDNQTIVASADAPSGSEISSAYRGWTRAKVHELSDMSPFTQVKAQQMVNQYAPDDRSTGSTRECTCLYFPIRAGDVVEWAQDGAQQRYLTQTVESDLNKWTVKLTLKKI